MKISEIISGWYKKNRRDLPWRQTRDPYRIWLSEVILQQTRVDQGLDYYVRFVERFPDIHALASAPEQEVLKLWQGLGYYSRARNLHAAARLVTGSFNGRFPNSFEALRILPGVGRYTAAAVASIAFGEPVAVVDGNVARVLSRLFMVDEPVNTTAGMKVIEALANDLLDRSDPGEHNQALMEFGALQCVPAGMDCEGCVLKAHCLARDRGVAATFPVKRKGAAVKTRYFTYLVIDHGGDTYIKERTGRDIWRHLWEYPLIEHPEDPPDETLGAVIGTFLASHNGAEGSGRAADPAPAGDLSPLNGAGLFTIRSVSAPVIHMLTHRRIVARFVRVEIGPSAYNPPANWKKVGPAEVGDYPLPGLIAATLER